MPYIGSQPIREDLAQQSFKVYRYTATAGQTVFSGADVNNQVLNVTPSNVEVHMNGLLLDATDYTVISSSVTLGTAANAGDELTITGIESFEVADTYDKATADGRYVNTAGDTMTGALALPSAGLTVGTNQLAVDSAGRVTMPYQPAFMATQINATHNQTGVVVDFNSIILNQGSHFSTSTNRFTAPVSGVYHFHVHTFVDTANTSNGEIYLRKNGSISGFGENIRNYTQDIHGGYGPPLTIQATVDCNANDYVDVFTNIGLHATRGSYFGGYLIG